MHTLSRRRFLAATAATGAGLALPAVLARPARADTPPPPVFPDPLMRFVWVDGAFNVRDFGGYAVDDREIPAGRLYRSSSLNHVTPAGVSLLATLNLGQVADFRSQVELARGLDVLPAGVTNLFVPVGDPEAGIAGQAGPPPPGGLSAPDPATLDEFRSYIHSTEGHISFGTAIRALAADCRPFLWHCNSGTYRTGWITAVLLTALGVSHDDVYADFLLSNVILGGTYAFAEYLDAAFAEANAVYGSFHQYLTAGLRVSPTTIARLRQRLLTSRPTS